MTTFIIVLIGQFLSIIGSELTGFTLGVWVFQQNNSATQFALISLCAFLPSIILSPFAGVLIDRWDRRIVMLVSDTGAGLATLTMAFLFATNNINFFNICGLTAITSIFGGFQYPAFVAASSLLLPKHQLARGSGLMSMSEGVGQLVAPALGGVLLPLINVQGVMMIDVATLFIAVTTLLFVRFPPVPKSIQAEDGAGSGSFWMEATSAWRFLIENLGLLGLVIYFGIQNIFYGIVLVLMTPLALTLSTPQVLGMVLSMGGVGMVIGSGLLSLTGERKRRTDLIFTFTALMGLSVFVAGFRFTVSLFTVATFLYSLALPLIDGSGQIIFQLKTPPQLQGRVLSFNGAVEGLAFALGYLLGGPLSDYVFKPLLVSGGPLAGTLGEIIGVGPGRGIGLFFMVVGVLHCFLAFAASRYAPLTGVETLLPDRLDKTVPHKLT